MLDFYELYVRTKIGHLATSMSSNNSFVPKKILLIKLRKLGDVLSTTPVARQLRNLYPDAEITFLTEPLGANVYKHSTYIDHLLILSRKPSWVEYVKMIFKVTRSNFDLVIDFYDHNKTALITLFSGAKYRYGFSKTGKRTLSYNRVVSLTTDDAKNVYCANHQLKLTSALGTSINDNLVEIKVNDEVRKRGREFVKVNKIGGNTIGFCVLSERALAQVSVELFIKIGDYLVGNGFSLYFIYGPNEKHLAQKVYDKMENKDACIIDYEVPTVVEQRVILEACCLYVGNDGGNKHLAVAAGIPTIGLFYSDQPLVWTPEDRTLHRFLQTKENENAFEEFKDLFSKWSFEEGKFIK